MRLSLNSLNSLCFLLLGMIFNTRDGGGAFLLWGGYRFRYLRGCGAIGFFGCGDSYPYHGATGLRVIKG